MANIHFKFGAMNAGKSTQLIQAAFNYKERGMTPLVLKPSIDTRCGAGTIHARVGLDIDCIEFGNNDSIWPIVKDNIDVNVVLIDEVQFMTESQVMDLVIVAKEYDITVVCYGLKTDFSGNLFVGSAKLLAIADKFEVLKTVCWCGDGATQNARVDKNGNMVTVGQSIEVGDVGRYVPLCMKHYARHQPTPKHPENFDAYSLMINRAYRRELLGDADESSGDTLSEVDMARPPVAE